MSSSPGVLPCDRKPGITLEAAIKNRKDCLSYLEKLGQMASYECVEAVRWSVIALELLKNKEEEISNGV